MSKLNPLFLAFAVTLASVAPLAVAAPADDLQAKRLQSYQGVRALLFAGVPLTAVFTPGACASAPPGTPPVSGGFVVRDFIEVIGSNIGFSNQHITLRPDGAAVLEIAQYRLLPDGTATVKTNFLSPTTYQPVSPALTFQCALGRGVDFAL
ncbi:hypothetical protein J5226_08320 [Lysobacter sp. K5869]|uniref:VirK family protein n=1 Tax=Lysobacter sp. K5869 TaxID=2820808 RepID=UPI001C062544|nr:VirK family protein [Lysobacter sp. K5869]QWP78381.1 hypothetical protein J5226_08320 [Lysobacter sp. K5869]